MGGLTVSALIGQGGTVLVVLLLGWLVATGRLRTAGNVVEIREDRDARVADAKEQAAVWREAYYKSEAARVENERMLRDSLDNGLAVLHLLESFRDRARNDTCQHSDRPRTPNSASGSSGQANGG